MTVNAGPEPAAVAVPGAAPLAAVIATEIPATEPGMGQAPRAWMLYLRRPGFLLALGVVLFVLLSAAVPAWFAGANPDATSGLAKLQAPSGAHWFGTDELGRDLFSRVIYGTRLTIEGTLIAVGLAIVTGLLLGVISGFFGRWIDVVLMRFVDVVLAIPALLLSLTIVTALGFGEVPVALAVGIGISPGFVRTTRAEVLKVKTLPYIEAARTGGAGWGRVLARHILPNSWGPVLVLALLDIGTAILVISSLSFLGFGAAPPAADWGGLIFDGSQYLVTSPWLALLPGLFVALVVFSVNHLARTVQEAQS